MSYYIATTVPLSFDYTVAAAERALAHERFGVISRIDIQATFKAKIGVEFRPYTILGACNPKLAREALQLEDKVGTMLPRNVVVQEASPGLTEVAAIEPVASMQVIDNSRLTAAAAEVRSRLERVIKTLEKANGEKP